MNKFILLFTVIVGLSTINAQAQNLSISSYGTDVSNSSFTQNPLISDSTFSHIIDITNNSTNTINVRVFKRDDNIISGSEVSICFNGNCWPSSMDTSGNATGLIYQPIDAGVTTGGLSSLTCDFFGHGNVGTSIVDYVVYNYDNMSDSVSVRVTYDVSTGINGNTITNSLVTYPNPANNSVNFKYNLSSKNSKIEIYNVVGNLVESINLDSNSGVYNINTSNYKQGAYFYSFVVDNKTVSTNKLIIAH